MSFRPTIAVYVNGQIADLGYYRNWDVSDLFFEAIAIATIFHQCKSIEEYRDKKFGAQKIFYSLAPEKIENTQENLSEMEGWSEYPILIDLSAGYIYNHVGCLSPEELRELPSVDVEKTFVGKLTAYEYILEHHKIPLSPIDYDKVRNVLLESAELRNRLSNDTLALLQKSTKQ